MATLRRIDADHHIVPPAYAACVRSRCLDGVVAISAMYEYHSLSDAQRASIDRGNAETLFARLRGN